MNFRQKIFGILPVDWRYDLSRHPALRSLLKSRWIPFLPVVFSLLLLTAACISSYLGGFSAGNYNFGVTVVWILWWSLLIIVMVPFFSRGWCTVCPFPLFGEWVQRRSLTGVKWKLSGLQRSWPKKLKNMWLMNILFLILSLGGGLFTVSPFWTFLVLGGMLVIATISMLIWEKRTFCLYICPVSGFQGLYANLSVCEIRRKNPDVCRDHKEKTCLTGNKQGYGCPWGLKPHSFRKNTYCGMCLECFKTCPHDNMALNLRPPGVDLLAETERGLDEAWKSFIMIGVGISFFLVFQGPYAFLKDWANAKSFTGYLSFASLHLLTATLFIPCVHFFFSYLAKAASGKSGVPLKEVFINLAYIIVPSGLGLWIAFSLGMVLPNGSYILHVFSDPFGLGWNLFGTANFPWTPVLTGLLQPLKGVALFAGFLFSLDIGYKITAQTFIDVEASKKASVVVLAYLFILHFLLLWIFTG